jgi:hypothetical protein
MDTSNPSAPTIITGAGRLAPPSAAPRGDDAPVPPEDIPGAPTGDRLPPAPDNRNILEKLFGG